MWWWCATELGDAVVVVGSLVLLAAAAAAVCAYCTYVLSLVLGCDKTWLMMLCCGCLGGVVLCLVMLVFGVWIVSVVVGWFGATGAAT